MTDIIFILLIMVILYKPRLAFSQIIFIFIMLDFTKLGISGDINKSKDNVLINSFSFYN